jgi:hypothetical protein
MRRCEEPEKVKLVGPAALEPPTYIRRPEKSTRDCLNVVPSSRETIPVLAMRGGAMMLVPMHPWSKRVGENVKEAREAPLVAAALVVGM